MNRDGLGVREQSVEVESHIHEAGGSDGPDDQEDDGACVHPVVVHLEGLGTPPESKNGDNSSSMYRVTRQLESLGCNQLGEFPQIVGRYCS